MSEHKKPPVVQTLSLLFENDPTWGDLIWFAEQVRASGVDLAEPIIFDYDHEDPTSGPEGLSFFAHPNPAELLGR